MTVTHLAIFPQTISNGFVAYLPADTTTKKTIVTAGANGSIVQSLTMSSTETANTRLFNFYITNGGTDYLITSVQATVNSGLTNGNPCINILNSGATPQWAGLMKDSNNNPVLYLASGSVLKVALSTGAIASGKEIDFFAQYGDF